MRRLTDNPGLLALGGAAGGGALGYLLAPLLSDNRLARALGLDPGRVRGATTTLGALLGAAPGLGLALARHKLRGSPWASYGPPRSLSDFLADESARSLLRSPSDAMPALAGPQPAPALPTIEIKQAADAATYSRNLWDPVFSVRQNLEDLSLNPFMPPGQRAQAKLLVAQAGENQGNNRLGSVGSLLTALPAILPQTVPTVAGAYLAASALGVPRRTKNTLTGAAFLASALTNFMKGGAEYKKHSTQFNLPPDIATQIKQLGELIDPADLDEDEGVEDEPHVTVLYGLTEDCAEAIQELMKTQDPIEIEFGVTDVFSHAGKPDVVYVKVVSPGLHKLHALLKKSCPCELTHPDYVPHATVAYVKEGTGSKYAGLTDLRGKSCVVDELQCCSTDGTKTPALLCGGDTDPDYTVSRETDEDNPKIQHVKVSTSLGQVVAAVRTYRDPDGCVRIDSLHVAPEHRGQGLAKRLLQRVEKCAGRRNLRLFVEPYLDRPKSAAQLVDFYRKHGFTLVNPQSLEMVRAAN